MGDLSTTASTHFQDDNSFGLDENLDEQPYSFRWTLLLWSKLQAAISAWLNTFVIHKSPGNSQEWHFRTLFVAEVTILPFVLLFGLISFWLLNRNTHLRKTKGSVIPLKGESSFEKAKHNDGIYDVDDEDEEGYSMQRVDDDDSAQASVSPSSFMKAPKRKNKTSRRQSIQAKLKAYDVEQDDDEAGLEDSDFEDDDNAQVGSISNSAAPVSPSHSTTDSVTDSETSKVFLSNEKRALWKIVKETPLFSYFNEEAMQICMEFVEYVDLKQMGNTLWTQCGYDGSLYYVVNGGVRVHFHDFEAPSNDTRGRGIASSEFAKQKQDKTPATFTRGAGTVVTSLLASLEGMVQHHLKELNSMGRFVGAAMRNTSAEAAADGTRLIRFPPACFCRVLDRFPDTVLRIVQAVLNRTQRVTVQTLVRTCGLRVELLVPPSKELRDCLLLETLRTSPWHSIQSFLERNVQSESDLEALSATGMKSVLKDACTVLSTILGVEDRLTIEVLEEQCSLLVMDPQGEHDGRILQEAGTVHDACYLLLRGSLEMVRLEFCFRQKFDF